VQVDELVVEAVVTVVVMQQDCNDVVVMTHVVVVILFPKFAPEKLRFRNGARHGCDWRAPER
jgi:hypothetical protein